MKVQCPECREIVAMEHFSTSAEGLRFKCAECGRVHFLANPDNLGEEEGAAAAPAETEAETAAPSPTPAQASAKRLEDERTCPKCGHAQSGGDACVKCGLNFLRFDPANLPPDPPEAAALWAQVMTTPGDDALHERFVQACNKAERLDYATRQYRILGREPGQEATAARMQVRIVSLAQAQLAPAGLEAGPSEKPKRNSRIIMWVVLVLGLGALGYLIYSSSEMLKKLY